MKRKSIYFLTTAVFLGISLGWIARGLCHFPRGAGNIAFFHSICVASAPERPKGPPRLERMVEGIDLSEEQKHKIQSLDESLRPELDKARSELDAKRANFEAAMDSGQSLDAMRPSFDALFEAKRKMETRQFELMTQVRDLLTPEQRVELRKIRKARGPGGPPPPGGFGGPGGPRGL